MLFRSLIGTFISVANMGMTNWSEFSEFIQGVIALVTMFLAGTYLISYIISLRITLKNKKISLISFLPILNVILFVISSAIWMWLNAIYIV